VVDPTVMAATYDEAGLSQQQPTETTGLLDSTRKLQEKSANVPYRNISGPRFRALFLSIIFGSTIAFFDSTLMASAHPVITSYFHASNAASWLSTVFYLTSTVFQPLYGRVSDTVGRRPVVLFAGFFFLVSTAACGAAPDIGTFIAARGICGLGAGGVVSLSGIMTSDVVKIEYRAIYQSYFNISWGLGNGLGAALGGYLCDRFGWRFAFYIQLPFILAYLVVTFVACPPDLGPNLAKTQGKTLREAFRTFDLVGALSLTVAVTCLILGVNLGGNVLSWGHPVVITSLALFAVATTSLILVERKAKLPIMPLKLLFTMPSGPLLWSNFCSAMVTNTVLFNVPLYLQAVKQTSPTKSGLDLFVLLVTGCITAIVSGIYITVTRRMKPPMAVGTFMSLCGAVLVTCFLSRSTPVWSVPLLIPYCSMGQGFFFPATTIAVLAVNAQDEQAVVTTTLGLLRNLGAIMGIAFSSWVFQNALLVYLGRTVTAPDDATKQEIIRTVRESIRAIHDLDPLHKAQVIAAYARSLKVTFALAIVFSVICFLLVWPVHLPRLQRQEDMDGRDTGMLTTVVEDENNEGEEYEYDSDEEEGQGSGEVAIDDIITEEEEPDGGIWAGTPPQVIRRTITRGSRRSRGSMSMAGSVPIGSVPIGSFHDLTRRPSFDTSF
jgi:MFS family permease